MHGLSAGQLLEMNDNPYVDVSSNENVLDEHGLDQLLQTVEPLSTEDGEILYQRAIQFVGEYLLNVNDYNLHINHSN